MFPPKSVLHGDVVSLRHRAGLLGLGWAASLGGEHASTPQSGSSSVKTEPLQIVLLLLLLVVVVSDVDESVYVHALRACKKLGVVVVVVVVVLVVVVVVCGVCCVLCVLCVVLWCGVVWCGCVLCVLCVVCVGMWCVEAA